MLIIYDNNKNVVGYAGSRNDHSQRPQLCEELPAGQSYFYIEDEAEINNAWDLIDGNYKLQVKFQNSVPVGVLTDGTQIPVEEPPHEPTTEERLEAVEMAILALMG